ncbi:MAG: LTA synthase family protein [Chitinophagaceae bacterium]
MKIKAGKTGIAYYTPVFIIALILIGISFITRVLLLAKASAGISWNFSNITGLFGIGLLYDMVIAAYCMLPLLLHLWWMNDTMYTRKAKPWIISIWAVFIGLLLFTGILPKDYDSGVRHAVMGYFIVRFAIYLLLAFGGKQFRARWRTTVILIDVFLITYLLLFNAVSECFFWDEFSVRYNFIAVDYLVYTNEVIGNIRESYPVGWIIAAVFVIAFAITWLLRKKITTPLQYRPSFAKRSLQAGIILLFPLCGFLFVKHSFRHFSGNEYVNELAGNGLFEFGYAFTHNELDYHKFYQTLSDRQAFTILRNQLSAPNSSFVSTDVFNIERNISYPEPEKHMNVVLISVESFSADFMRSFGNTQNITPHLDSLAQHSLFFTKLYASGTRTVRGLESLSLSIPPTPGQSTVKRPNNENLFSLGSVFRSKGYTTQFIYGGYGYFDNMKYFFSNNGYTVIDRTALKPEQIHYSNIWGVADEDLFTLALQTMDSNYLAQKPFFTQVMTVSNHRPYTYPDGRIDIPSASQSREGAVKYTDYAIAKFLREAQQKPWFGNTIFVIVADHCAGSAGSVELPVTGYHIPLLIYSPGNLAPQRVDKLTAQIDIAPTILGLLRFNYRSKFFGQDIFSIPEEKERAFISTYQGLGYLKNNKLVIQTPVKKTEEFTPDFITGKATATPVSDSLLQQSIAWYQCAAWMLKNRKYNR